MILPHNCTQRFITFHGQLMNINKTHARMTFNHGYLYFLVVCHWFYHIFIPRRFLSFPPLTLCIMHVHVYVYITACKYVHGRLWLWTIISWFIDGGDWRFEFHSSNSASYNRWLDSYRKTTINRKGLLSNKQPRVLVKMNVLTLNMYNVSLPF